MWEAKNALQECDAPHLLLALRMVKNKRQFTVNLFVEIFSKHQIAQKMTFQF